MSTHKYNVLLVDDDSIYRYAATKSIQATGLCSQLSVCSNGEEALSYISSNINNDPLIPDIILLDVNMPVMNGWDFLEAYDSLKTDLPKKIIIYVVSSSLNESDIRKSKQFATVKDYIIKPVIKEKFAQILEASFREGFAHN